MVDYERALDDLGFRHAVEGASRRLGLARRRRRFALGRRRQWRWRRRRLGFRGGGVGCLGGEPCPPFIGGGASQGEGSPSPTRLGGGPAVEGRNSSPTRFPPPSPLPKNSRLTFKLPFDFFKLGFD